MCSAEVVRVVLDLNLRHVLPVRKCLIETVSLNVMVLLAGDLKDESISHDQILSCSKKNIKIAQVLGLEPRTVRLTAECSTN